MSDPSSFPEPRIETDLAAIRHNIATIRADIGVPVLAVVKANAYGHGAVAVARAAIDGGARGLGVVDVAEALALREAGIDAPIVAWLHGPGTDWIAAIEADIELGVSSIEQLELLATAAALADRPARIHVKVDTGLGRNGVHRRDWGAVFTLVAELVEAGNGVFAGVFSHLSGTSAADDLEQVATFERAVAVARRRGVEPEARHLAASAGSFDHVNARFDLARIGIAMYGLTPYAPTVAPRLALRPALRLVAPVVSDVHGTRVEVGTADGLPPLDAAAAAALQIVDAHGRVWRLGAIGDVTTEVAPLDGTANTADAGLELTIIGGDASSADAWAAAAGTIGYEIVTRLTPRLTRVAIDTDAVTDADGAAIGDGPEPIPSPERRWRTVRGDLAPKRVLSIDGERFRAGLAAQLAAGDGALDVTADAYGFGAARLAALAGEAGLSLVVRTHADAVRVARAAGERPRVDPAIGAGARAAYGFGDGLARLVTELVHVKRVGAGQGVSYGYEWSAAEPTTLGLVPLGYGDALPRRAGAGLRLRVLGETAFDDALDGGDDVDGDVGSDLADPDAVVDAGIGADAHVDADDSPVASGGHAVVGRVAMDQVVLDLGDGEAWAGMAVVVFGGEAGDPELVDLARDAGVSPESFVAALGPRVQRAICSPA